VIPIAIFLPYLLVVWMVPVAPAGGADPRLAFIDSLFDEPGYWDLSLLEAKEFSGRRGDGRSIATSEFLTLLASSDVESRLASLAEAGSGAAFLYALCGLSTRDSDLVPELLRSAALDNRLVLMGETGCILRPMEVSKTVESREFWDRCAQLAEPGSLTQSGPSQDQRYVQLNFAADGRQRRPAHSSGMGHWAGGLRSHAVRVGARP
jgi:hypothetical protein